MMEPKELIDFADRHSAVTATSPQNLNPYKLGSELFRDIEERYNKGQFGIDYYRCENMAEKNTWNKQLNLGRKKIEIRKVYSDLMFIDDNDGFCQKSRLVYLCV